MAWGLGLLALALGLNTIAGMIYARRQIEQSMATLQTEIATVTARHIQTYISRKIERLSDTASSMALYPIGGSEQSLLVHLLLKNDPSFSEVAVLDAHGRERVKIAERKSYLTGDFSNQNHNEAYKTAILGRVFISSVYTSDRAEPYVVLAVPLKSAPQNRVGVLIANMSLKFLWQVVREKT
ncbi:MAG: cache domain-containing protein, partial [Deltaproteobacteria bacterium]|nr:cache domain-containing protein [Deltaproteobacteria bacterium]